MKLTKMEKKRVEELGLELFGIIAFQPLSLHPNIPGPLGDYKLTDEQAIKSEFSRITMIPANFIECKIDRLKGSIKIGFCITERKYTEFIIGEINAS